MLGRKTSFSLALGAGISLLGASAAASVVTTASFQGTATTTDGAGTPFTQNYTTSGTAEFFRTVTPGQEFSGANVFGTIETRPDGQLNFSNTVGGLGRQSSATSRTSVRQVVTNDTGSAQNVNFQSVILEGALGMWLLDTTQCSNSTMFDCAEYEPPNAFGPQTIADLAGPTSTGLSIQVLANGQVAFNLDIALGLTGFNGSTSSFDVDVADGAALNGFGMLGDPDENRSLFYGWDQTDFNVDLGALGAGEELIIEFIVETAFSNQTDCSFETICVASLSGFGDPIKSTGNVQTRSFSLQSFLIASEIVAAPTVTFSPAMVVVHPVPLPAAAWFMALGLGGAGLLSRQKRRALAG